MEKEFHNIRNELYNKANNRWLLSVIINLFIPIVCLLTSINNYNNYILSIIILILPLINCILKLLSDSYKNKADKCRRMILYSNGYGKKINFNEIANIKSFVLGYKLKDAEYIDPYYSSKIQAGPQRLVDMVSESAYFTYNLAYKSFSLFLVISLAIFTSTIISIYYYIINIIQVNSVDKLLIFSKTIPYIISIIVINEITILAYKFFNYYISSKNIYNESSKMLINNIALSDVNNIIEDYNILVMQSPPILNIIYSRYSNEINKAYRSAQENK